MNRLKITIVALLVFFAAAFGGEEDSRIGTQAPAFELPVAGTQKTLSLNDLKGSVIIVDFWASWCGPCRKSLPHLQTLEEKYKGLKVLTINIDDKEKNAYEFIEDFGLDLTVLLDRKKSVVEAYGVSAMPTALILDRKGIIRYVHSGYTERNMQQLEENLRSLLQ